jgi:ribosome-binding factor A
VDGGRARKLADRIAEIVAEMLERRVKDPRLGFVTVTEARLSGDLREATVYYTVYGSQEEQDGTEAALKSATGLIRSEVGRQTGLRHTPSLSFVRDTLPEGAARIEALLSQARAADQALAAARQRARPAGDPDPYRQSGGPAAGGGPMGGAPGAGVHAAGGEPAAGAHEAGGGPAAGEHEAGAHPAGGR